MLVLGIESSCDELGMALIDSQSAQAWHTLRSQIDLHARHGGVVPEVAARDHLRQQVLLLNHFFEQVPHSLSDVDLLAYTSGPGLIGALLMGSTFAHALARGTGAALAPVHHLEGHVLLSTMGETMYFPCFILLVSGGHTQLILMHTWGQYDVLGQTLDDAAGEALDKVAKYMGLGYPGGPIIEKIARNGRSVMQLPVALRHQKGFDFSFSGLKTAAMQAYDKTDKTSQDQADLAFALQNAIWQAFVNALQRAMDKYPVRQIVVAGGVSANQAFKQRLTAAFSQQQVIFPPPRLATDNGLMIAYTAMLRAEGLPYHEVPLDAKSRWPIESLSPFSIEVTKQHLDIHRVA